MKNSKLWSSIWALLIVASMVLGACTQATPTQAPGGQATSAPVTEPTKAPAAEATQPPAAGEATKAPTTGGEMSFDNVDPTGQTVVFWHQHSKAREEALKKIVDDFNAKNEWKITVQPEYQGSYNDIFNKMLGVLNTPDAPDLVVAYQNQAATYQLADSLVDMNPMVNSAKWGLSEAEQKDFFDWAFKQDVFPTYGNARLGWPPNRSMEVMYYNMDWLKELGYNEPPKTPDQFKEMACKAAKTPFSKATAQGSMGYELSVDASRFASWTFAFGGDIYDYTKNEYTYNSDAAQKAMAFLQDLFKSGCASIVTENFGDQTDFGTGKLLFSVGSSSGLPFYKDAVDQGAKFNWSVGAIPHTTPDPAMNIYGASVSIPKTTPEKELAAWLFLKYYTSPEVQAQWAQASEYFPARASVAEGLKDYFANHPAYKAAFDLLKFGKFEPPVPGYDFVRVKVGDAMAAIANGDDVASTLSTLNETSNQMLKEQEAAPLPTPVPTKPPEATKAPEATAATTGTVATAAPTAAAQAATKAPPPPPVCAPLPNPPVVKAGDLGSPENPIVMAFVPSGESGKIATASTAIADCLNKMTGLTYKVETGTSYGAAIEAMGAGKAQVGFLNTFSILLAEEKYGIIPVLANLRNYNTIDIDPDKGLKGQLEPFYKGQFIAKADSGITKLEDLKGKTFCFVDPNSASGYIVPRIILKANGIDPDTDFAATVNAGSHPNVAIAVYKGDCDAGVTFIDVLTDKAANLAGQYPDIAEKVKAFAVTDRIPNDGVQYVKDFPVELQTITTDALLAMAKDPGGKAVLASLYTINAFEKIDASFYNDFLEVLKKAGVDPATLIK